MEQYKEQIKDAFISKVRSKGYFVESNHDKGQLLDIFKDHNYVCSLMKNENFRYPADTTYQEEIHEIVGLYEKTKEMYQHYDMAMPLLCEGLTHFHVLSEYKDVVLAAKMRKNGSLEFVTWNYDRDRTGVCNGHYFESNYEAAKKDFAVRSSLIPGEQVFHEEELKAVYQSCVFRGRNDNDITFEEEKALQKLMEKIENSSPGIQEKIAEAERQVYEEKETVAER